LQDAALYLSEQKKNNKFRCESPEVLMLARRNLLRQKHEKEHIPLANMEREETIHAITD
jgi:hypothetical protein